MKFTETVDVVVIGFGLGGGIAALNAAQAGAKTLLLEKSTVPGGLSICSYGAVRSAHDPDQAFAYLQATNGGRTPEAVIRALADGMCELEAYVRELAQINGARVITSVEENEERARAGDPYRRQIRGNYPLPGTDTFYHTSVVDVPGFDARVAYPWANGAPNGPKLFKVVHDNVLAADVEVRLGVAATRLVAGPATREVQGVTVIQDGKTRHIRVRCGVVLASGGFEGNAEMKAQFLEAHPVLNAAARSNTGDGIRMAQDLGAALWHMWHVHGAYGFRHTDPAYPYGMRVKRFPDWFPGEQDKVNLKMAWILLDGSGKRFMSEYQPYTQDTAVRPLAHFDPVTQRAPRNPAYLICDDAGRRLYPLGKATSNDEGLRYDWSFNNLKEIDNGILKRANTLEELAAMLGIDPVETRTSVARWNALCAAGSDEDHHRPANSMLPIIQPPYYGAPVWAVISNTQGGPVHDAHSRVIDVYGKPIPRLYAAGELGSSFGHLYLSGGNIAECFVTGRIAGRHVAQLAPLAA
ncbi:MAG: fumarate reductase/succinate dehyfrogenase, flavoprotein subunit [Proteobacteria bacterium]|nr:fumarate reductase/succinate dehyfrogenase, flavoprotein subunit [Pseudomonadota bacterium]